MMSWPTGFRLPVPLPQLGDLVRLWVPGEDVVPAHIVEIDESDPLVVDVVPIEGRYRRTDLPCAHVIGGPHPTETCWSYPRASWRLDVEPVEHVRVRRSDFENIAPLAQTQVLPTRGSVAIMVEIGSFTWALDMMRMGRLMRRAAWPADMACRLSNVIEYLDAHAIAANDWELV